LRFSAACRSGVNTDQTTLAALDTLISLSRIYLGSDAAIPTEAAYEGLLDAAVRHSLAPIVLWGIDNGHLPDCSPPVILAARILAAHAAQRVRMLTAEVQKVSVAMHDAGIAHAVRKGPAITASYREAGHRAFSDMDLLIDRANAASAVSLVERLGYEPGIFSPVTNQVTQPSRELAIQYRLNPDHLPHFTRTYTDAGMAQGLDIDFAFTIGWHGDGLGLDTPGLLQRSVVQDGLRCLDPCDRAVDVLLHAHRELFLIGATRQKPPNLRVLIDCQLQLVNQVQNLLATAERRYSKATMQAICRVDSLVAEVLSTDRLLGSVDMAPESGAVLRRAVIRQGVIEDAEIDILDRMSCSTHREYLRLLGEV